jgi:hypothetical protein
VGLWIQEWDVRAQLGFLGFTLLFKSNILSQFLRAPAVKGAGRDFICIGNCFV